MAVYLPGNCVMPQDSDLLIAANIVLRSSAKTQGAHGDLIPAQPRKQHLSRGHERQRLD